MGIKIEPDRWYDEWELRQTGWFTEAQLRRGRAVDRLQSRKLGRKRVYLGRWLLAWLAGDGRQAEPEEVGA